MDKIKQLQQSRAWLDELKLFKEIVDENPELSIRSLAILIGKSKSWVDRSMQLLKGLKKYPYLRTEPNRNAVYSYIQKKRSNATN